MKTFPTEFATELSRTDGITPIWILRIVVEGVTYDLSDVAITFPAGSLGGFTSTLPWVQSWGQVRESISGNIGEILVADLSVSVLVDQDDDNNIKHLALQHELEKNPAILFLWLEGLDPTVVSPQTMFKGYIKDISIPDETSVDMSIEDESSRMTRNIGTKITSEAFPHSDPDTVGKLIPIVYGSVEKLPALCVDSGFVTALKSDVDAISTSMFISEFPSLTSLTGMKIAIEDEMVQIVSVDVPTKKITVTRGIEGTTPLIHGAGTLLIENKTTPLVYFLADHPLDAIGTVFARFQGIDVDITANVTKHLGTIGDTLAAPFNGRAAITIDDIAKVSQKIYLQVLDTLAIQDNGHGHSTGYSPTTVSQPSPTQPVSGTAYPNSTGAANCFGSYIPMTWVEWTPTSGINQCVIKAKISSGTIGWALIAAEKHDFYNPYKVLYTWNPKVTNMDVQITVTDQTAMNYKRLYLCADITNTTGYPQSYPSGIGPGYIVTASRDINGITGGVATSSGGANVGRSGGISLSGNSVSDVKIGEAILVNVTRNITTPAAVIGDILSTYCGDSSLVQVGTLPAFYTINGAITEYRSARYWVDTIAFQCKSWFRKIAGVSKLIVRTAAPVSPITLPSCCLNNEGMREISYRKAPINDVINIINVLYERDWTSTGKMSESYRKSMASKDQNSVDIYGPLEQPDLFQFDFVRDPSMASDLGGFYHDFFAIRKWFATFPTFLDHADLEFADEVLLGFANDLIGVIVEAGLQPGDVTRMDRTLLTVATTKIPAEIETALATYLGDYLVTKDREVLTYV